MFPSSASVQSFFSVPERPGHAVKLTTAHYYTPKGELIHGKGLEPDVSVPQTGEEFWLATLKRVAETHPELACTNTLERLSAQPDRPLAAAVELLSGANPDEAAPPPADIPEDDAA